ncbi:polymerase associated protein [Porcine ephemerovirus 1]|uniref:Polymerase associated protein n=1 Tax=Porcine ephemerovirus 1 TaxID=2928256 RepID=A0AAX3A930_9RHAB|nr:polymerase associated protein [Porcine ephemerovirus 1]UNP42108.1 polymerase associated protein [Porcine ephemerovirus 1]
MERHQIARMIPYNLGKIQEVVMEDVFDDDAPLASGDPQNNSICNNITDFNLGNPLSDEQASAIMDDKSDWVDQIERFNQSLKEFDDVRNGMDNPKICEKSDVTFNLTQPKAEVRSIRRLSSTDFNNVGVWDGRITVSTDDIDSEMFKLNAIFNMFSLKEGIDYSINICANNINLIKLDNDIKEKTWFNQIDLVRSEQKAKQPEMKMKGESKAKVDEYIEEYLKKLERGIVCDGYRGKKIKLSLGTLGYHDDILNDLYFDNNPTLKEFVIVIAKHTQLFNRLNKIIKWDSIA